MDRITLTEQQTSFLSSLRESLGIQPGDPVQEGNNVVQDDNLRVDDAWDIWVVGGAYGIIYAYIPAWDEGDERVHFPIDVVPYVTDRAGPDGQTMPLFDPPPVEEEPPVDEGGEGGEGGGP